MTRGGSNNSDDASRRPEPEETLRLLDTFNSIESDELRETIIALAQRYASTSPDFNRAMRKLIKKVGNKH